MKQFNAKYKKLMEDMGAATGNVTSTVLGPTQGHPAQVGKSGDFYAPGDNRNIWGSASKPKKKLKSKFKAPGFKKESKIIRRTFPGM